MPIGYFGEFELIEELGRGGMGIVYKARDPSQNQFVALKVLRAGAQATEDDLRQFLNEARVAAWLRHPHIVPISALGKHHDGLYILMKLIDGSSLDRKLGEYTSDLRASVRLVRTLAEAVHCAHQRATLHLDLKPSKVLIDESGEPYVTGFGLNKQFDTNDELMPSGAVVGKRAYMAPEQVTGQRGMLTTATDVYGLGAILYALITGRAPFVADAPSETLAQNRDGTLELPSKRHPGIWRDLKIVVLRCLETEAGAALQLGRCPGRRPGSPSARQADSSWAFRLGHLTSPFRCETANTLHSIDGGSGKKSRACANRDSSLPRTGGCGTMPEQRIVICDG